MRADQSTMAGMWQRFKLIFKSKANAAMDKGMGRGVSNPILSTVRREFQGIVRDGVIVLEDGRLPDGTRVQVRVRE